jgi:hypothetical protein
MITFQAAEKTILARLERDQKSLNDFGSSWPQAQERKILHLAISEVIEYEFGWVFHYNSKEFIDTQDFQFSLVGNAPFIVSKEDGLIYQTGTYRPLEFFVNQFRQGIRNLA